MYSPGNSLHSEELKLFQENNWTLQEFLDESRVLFRKVLPIDMIPDSDYNKL